MVTTEIWRGEFPLNRSRFIPHVEPPQLVDGGGLLDRRAAVKLFGAQFPQSRIQLNLYIKIIHDHLGIGREVEMVSPEVVTYLTHRLQDSHTLTIRLGWKEIGLRQAAAIKTVLTGGDIRANIGKLRTNLSVVYPTIGPVLSADGRSDISIPARYFFDMFDTYLTSDERAQIETGIRATALTPTEYAVLFFTTQGRPNKEIAEILDISWQTVKNHETNIRAKLSVAAYPVYDRVQASIVALRSGLVPLRLADHYYRGMDKRDLTEYFYVELSHREQELLSYRVRGYSDKEIARVLGKSKQTVKNQMSNILDKLDCGSGTTAGLVVFYYLVHDLPPPIQLKDLAGPRTERRAPVRAAIHVRKTRIRLEPIRAEEPNIPKLPETVFLSPDREDAVVLNNQADIPFDEEHLVLSPGDVRMWRQTFPQHYGNPEITQLYVSPNGNGTGHFARIALSELLSNDRSFLSTVALDNFIEIALGTVNAHHPKFTIPALLEAHRSQATFQIRALRKFFAQAIHSKIPFHMRPRWRELRMDMDRVEKEVKMLYLSL